MCFADMGRLVTQQAVQRKCAVVFVVNHFLDGSGCRNKLRAETTSVFTDEFVVVGVGESRISSNAFQSCLALDVGNPFPICVMRTHHDDTFVECFDFFKNFFVGVFETLFKFFF